MVSDAEPDNVVVVHARHIGMLFFLRRFMSEREQCAKPASFGGGAQVGGWEWDRR